MFFCTIDVVKEKLFTQKYKFCFILSNLGDSGQQLIFRDCPGFFWTSGHTKSASLIIRRTGIKLYSLDINTDVYESNQNIQLIISMLIFKYSNI